MKTGWLLDIDMALLDWIILILFFASLIGVGFWLSLKTDDSDDFFLSHRNMPWWAASASVAATALSAGTVITSYSIHYTKLYDAAIRMGCFYAR